MLGHIAEKQEPALDSDGALKRQTKASSAARLAVDTYAAAVQEQPEAKLDEIKDLAPTQQAAKADASAWQTTVSPLLTRSNTDLMSFANAFNSYYNPLFSLAGDIGTGDNRAQFVQGLQTLVGEIEHRRARAEEALQALNGFDQSVATDSRNFVAIVNEAHAKYEGDQGKIDQLTKLEDSLRSSMNSDLTIIAAGATATVVGGLAIAVGLLAEIPSGGASTLIVVGGLAVVGGGTAAMTVAGINYTNKKKQLADTIKEVATLNSQIATLHGLEGQFGRLADASSQAVQALTAMSRTWTTLGTQFNAVIDALEETGPDQGTWLRPNLLAAKQDWEDVHYTAQLIEKQLSEVSVTSEVPQKVA